MGWIYGVFPARTETLVHLARLDICCDYIKQFQLKLKLSFFLWTKQILDFFQISGKVQKKISENHQKRLNPFQPSVALLHPLKTSETLKVLYVFWGYSNATLGCNRVTRAELHIFIMQLDTSLEPNVFLMLRDLISLCTSSFSNNSDDSNDLRMDQYHTFL